MEKIQFLIAQAKHEKQSESHDFEIVVSSRKSEKHSRKSKLLCTNQPEETSELLPGSFPLSFFLQVDNMLPYHNDQCRETVARVQFLGAGCVGGVTKRIDRLCNKTATHALDPGLFSNACR